MFDIVELGISSLLILFGFATFVLSCAAIIFIMICRWKIFKKMGEEGWKSIVPVYNCWIECQHTCGEGLVGLLKAFGSCIPYVGVAVPYLFSWKLYRRFGKSTLFCAAMSLVPMIGDAVIAFDKSEFNHDPLLDKQF